MEKNDERADGAVADGNDLLLLMVGALFWAACCLAARCGLFVAYGRVSFPTLLGVAQVRAAVAIATVVYALAAAFAPDSRAFWWAGACLSAVCVGTVHYCLIDKGTAARFAFIPLIAATGACLLPAWWGPDAAWHAGAWLWVAASAASIACDARSYGRLSAIDMAHLFLDAHALYASGLSAPYVHPLLPLAAGVVWLLRGLDAIIGSQRRPGSPPAALLGVVRLWRAALIAGVINATLFILLGGMSGSDGWPVLGPCVRVIALLALLTEEQTSIPSALAEPYVIALMERAGWKRPPPRGRMARRVRAPVS
ncbi:hypothetical protein pmac_cds_181 [Pandoravirus macleodensis]|uniref:Uncharacterized protein n=1 Tax=Pandoravirus macleodensis TaxID=2107707 RepID=A0A2U7UEH3_9VIRU|nr:hypothetical protein pmac_cds_181 [Pandoravirus macleodensis]AVK76869.1 hypothetical protein pmac_cds_181 [Pandoravirus macleodensis]